MAENLEFDLEASCRQLYGLIHARYILTQDGLDDMVSKYNDGSFGTCPRVGCNRQTLLPVGLYDEVEVQCVKGFCLRCKDVFHYEPLFDTVDGAFFGRTFAHLFILEYPVVINHKHRVYEPAVYGFKLHAESPYYTLGSVSEDDSFYDSEYSDNLVTSYSS